MTPKTIALIFWTALCLTLLTWMVLFTYKAYKEIRRDKK